MYLHTKATAAAAAPLPIGAKRAIERNEQRAPPRRRPTSVHMMNGSISLEGANSAPPLPSSLPTIALSSKSRPTSPLPSAKVQRPPNPKTWRNAADRYQEILDCQPKKTGREDSWTVKGNLESSGKKCRRRAKKAHFRLKSYWVTPWHVATWVSCASETEDTHAIEA